MKKITKNFLVIVIMLGLTLLTSTTTTEVKAAGTYYAKGELPVTNVNEANRSKPKPVEIEEISLNYDGFNLLFKVSDNTEDVEIYRSTSMNGKYYKMTNWNCMNVGDNEYYLWINKLLTGKTYYFKVRSKHDFTGKKLKSDWVTFSVTPKLDYVELLDLDVDTSKYQYTINWWEVQGAHGYLVYRSKDGDNWRKVTRTKNEYYKVKTPNNYTYRIRAYKKVGNEYVYSRYSYFVMDWSEWIKKPLDLKVQKQK